MEFKLKALTDIWTGGVDKNVKGLHLTGFKGSIRWWYEVLIRGLGNYACDPTEQSSHCHLKLSSKEKQQIKFQETALDKIVKRYICPACYLFGCTGWSGKVGLRITDPEGNIKKNAIKKDHKFNLLFVKMKPLELAEQSLLEMTMKLIVDYGAIGGRTVYKPSEDNRNNNNLSKQHHYDYGLIARSDSSNIQTEKVNGENVSEYLSDFPKKADKNNNEWPDLNEFWFIKGICLDRTCINNSVGRDNNGKYKKFTEENIFLGGFGGKEKELVIEKLNKYRDVNAVSKKIFSFHRTENKQQIDLPLCFGYAKKNEHQTLIKKIFLVNGDLSQEQFEKLVKNGEIPLKYGSEVRDEL